MNRRKKINSTLKAKAKKANAKKAGSSKSTYVSKADRAQLAEIALGDSINTEDSTIDATIANNLAS